MRKRGDDTILVGGEPHPNMTPATTGPGGNRRARLAAASSKSTLAYKCQGCGRKVLELSKTRAERDQVATAQRVRAAIETHKRATGCSGEQPSIADHVPKDVADATGVEMICAGCGLIVCTFPAKAVKDQRELVNAEAGRMLRSHVADTGCTGEHDKTKPTPKRRDARCALLEEGKATYSAEMLEGNGHIKGCRCQVEEERKAEEARQKAIHNAEHPDPGVFKEMPS